MLSKDFFFESNSENVEFIHIGNNFECHGSLLLYAMMRPCIVVLHDTNLSHMLRRSFADREFVNRVTQMLIRAHSVEIAIRAVQHYISVPGSHQKAEETDEISMIVIDTILNNSLAIVVHGESEAQLLEKRLSVPVYSMQLPHQMHIVDNMSYRTPGVAPESKVLNLVLFGHIGGNRCVKEVVAAVIEVADEIGIKLHIAGRIADASDEAAVRGAVLTGHVEYHGIVSDDKLNRLIKDADLAVNLRSPSMGEASSSQLKIFQYSKPSIVSNVGWYKNLPDDAVIKVEDLNTLPALFKTIAEIRESLPAMGEVGRSYLEKSHRFDCYVQGILDISAKYKELRTLWLSRQYTARSFSLLAGYDKGFQLCMERLYKTGSYLRASMY